ncbi:MAG: hypothetical protein SPG09_08540 [Lachnospiraceae bacterium]|nr:hypothetical protein [bacterium]MDY5517639.1 hypothetical protein [Lachnospiraceae bacterium]
MLMKRFVKVIMVIVAVLFILFLSGRFGWKLGGFGACQDAGIDSVEVSDHAVRMTGFYPGSFPEGFCGYYAKEKEGKLYVGFRFSAVFGMFESGDFDITIPVKESIEEVIVKTRMGERPVWNAYNGFISRSEPYGVFVKLEPGNAWSVSMRYEDLNNKMINTYYTACESGDHLFMNNDIIYVAKETEAPVPFILTVYAEDDTVVAYEEFNFDTGTEKMYLTVTEDGRIVEESADE